MVNAPWFSAGALVAHLVGDYGLQSHWMARVKPQRWKAAISHGLAYSLPFLFMHPSWRGWLLIVVSHVLIDHYGLARYVVWAKNTLLSPGRAGPWRWLRTCGCSGAMECTDCDVWSPPWSSCRSTGYPSDVPPFLAVWLLIVADNTLHLLCNALAFRI